MNINLKHVLELDIYSCDEQSVWKVTSFCLNVESLYVKVLHRWTFLYKQLCGERDDTKVSFHNPICEISGYHGGNYEDDR
jgi:hypothetical protein